MYATIELNGLSDSIIRGFINKIACEVAHKMKIPSIELQHGSVQINHFGYSYPNETNNN